MPTGSAPSCAEIEVPAILSGATNSRAPGAAIATDTAQRGLVDGLSEVLTIVDDCTKEAIDLAVDFDISGQHVTRILDHTARFRGYPVAIRTDQGPEFIGKALAEWGYRNGVQLKLIHPGKPTQNAYIESVNGKSRNEYLNERWLHSLAHARAVIQAWRQEYNEQRPHSILALPDASRGR